MLAKIALRRSSRDWIAPSRSPHNVTDRRARDSGETLVVEERGVGRAQRGSLQAVRRELRQLLLRGEPAPLIPEFRAQDVERLPVEALQRLGLSEDRGKLGELDSVGPQLPREIARRPLSFRGQRSAAVEEARKTPSRAREGSTADARFHIE